MKFPLPVKSVMNRTSGPRLDEGVSNIPGPHPEVRIAVGYVILASIWIIGSDHMLAASAKETSELAVSQSLKGLNFVLTTGLLLFVVLRRAYAGWRLAEEQRTLVIRRARERYRNLCSRTQALREEDRTRLSREIHDELGQLLTSIKMELRQVENSVTELNDRALNPIIDRLVDASELVDHTIGAMQRISANLRPSALDHLGLAAALNEESEHFSRRTKIPCSLKMEEPLIAIPAPAETAIFRIFQESLTNIARHAHASKVEASVASSNDGLELRIHDNGRGMEPAVLENANALGIIGMIERAEGIGGSLDFESQPGQGTTVTLVVPMTSPLPERPEPA